MLRVFSILSLAFFLFGCEKENTEPANDNYTYQPPPPYGTGGCLFEGDQAFFVGQVLDSITALPINNYRITHDQGIVVHSDTVSDYNYLISAAQGYFYDGCNFVITMPDTIHVDLKDATGNDHHFWFLSETLILGDTVNVSFEL